jgi:hypothetical protein
VAFQAGVLAIEEVFDPGKAGLHSGAGGLNFSRESLDQAGNFLQFLERHDSESP